MDEVDKPGQAGIQVTDAMVAAAQSRLRQFTIGEDLEVDWLPAIISAALEAQQRFVDASTATPR
jgi:hypothetical protein